MEPACSTSTHRNIKSKSMAMLPMLHLSHLKTHWLAQPGLPVLAINKKLPSWRSLGQSTASATKDKMYKHSNKLNLKHQLDTVDSRILWAVVVIMIWAQQHERSNHCIATRTCILLHLNGMHTCLQLFQFRHTSLLDAPTSVFKHRFSSCRDTGAYRRLGNFRC